MRREKIKTSYPGVRYREHPSRKHGQKPDRYYFIRFKIDNVDKEEGVGWSSEGMTAEKANKLRADIRENIRIGKGAYTLAEAREANEELRKAEQEAQKEQERKNILFNDFFINQYLPAAKYKKKPNSIITEEGLHRKWIAPALESVALVDISLDHLEKISQAIIEAHLSPATLKYAFAVISQVWTYAKEKDLVIGDSPTKKLKKPKLNNQRIRYLTEDEANRLLEALSRRSPDLQDIATLSLFCGLRAGEIFGLHANDIDLENETVFLRHPKPQLSRYAYITDKVKHILKKRLDDCQSREALLFPSRAGSPRSRISKAFDRTVEDLGLNAGVTDRRQKVVFHTLRHTFASWLVQRGVPLYTTQTLMGHSEFRMTQRYAHLGPSDVKEAVKVLQGILSL